MTEWLLLVLLVPAIVVPVVLLFGFAGCDRVFGLEHVDPVDPPPPGPIIVSAKGKSLSAITLMWMADPAAEQYRVRTNQGRPDGTGGPAGDTFGVATSLSEYPDNAGLDPRTTYEYIARAVFADGDTSQPSAPVRGTTSRPSDLRR